MTLDLSQLNEAQRDAVTHVDGPLLVLAGPGSGKTRVITWRIAYLIEQGISPWSILALTFTNKAASEMRERVTRLVNGEEPRVSTFHSFGAYFLRREAETLGLNKNFTIIDESARATLMKKVCHEVGIDKDLLRIGEVVHAISQTKGEGVSTEACTEKAVGYREEKLANAYARYQALLTENAAVDFDDLLLLPVRGLERDPLLRQRYAERYRYLLVDEYQDTNALQYRLTNLLGEKHRNVCVTGDPDQSIYSWRGADISNILSFERDFPEARVVVLGKNYRSTSTIVAAAGALVRHNVQRKHKDLFTDNDEGSLVRVLYTSSETHEARRIAETLSDFIEHEGLGYGEIAIFYRTNAQSRAIENALREAAIPYVIVGSVEFYRRKEIADLLAWLRLLVNPFDEVAFGRAIASPSRGVGDVSAAKVIEAARRYGTGIIEACGRSDVQGLLRGRAKTGLAAFAKIAGELSRMPRAPVADIVERLLVLTDFEHALVIEDPARGAERVENVRELVSDAAIFDEQHRGAELGDYLEKVALIQDVDKYDPARRAVSLMTLHSAKGLEFPAVFIAGVEDGSIPHVRSITGESGDLEEERRLFYVGITRARRFLTLTVARHREQFGQSTRNAPSRFLREMPAELFAVEDHTGGLFGAAAGLGAATGRVRVPFDDDDVSNMAVAPDPWEDADSGPGLTRLPGGSAGGREKVPFDDGDGSGDRDGMDGAGEALAFGRGAANRAAAEAATQPAFARPLAAPGGHSEATLNVGDRVRHQMFGIGTVLAFTRHTGGTRAKILFQGWGEKNLALEFARLERL